MHKILLSTFFVLSFFVFSIQAQSYRLRSLADDLQRKTDELAEKTYSDFTRSFSNSRTEVDNLLLTQQLRASADLFRRMVNDNRSNPELRDAASALNDLFRRKSYSSSNSYDWQQVQRNIDDLVRETGGSGGWGNNDQPQKEVIGRVRWRGTVDAEVHLTIRGNSIEVKTIGGTEYKNGNFNFTSPLPNRKVDIQIDKKKGRGSVKVIQEPSRENNFTAVIQIRDNDGGARDYDLDIYWTRD